jgi:hypothetical protein
MCQTIYPRAEFHLRSYTQSICGEDSVRNCLN